ncbi:MAG: hypothetical protein DRG78_07960 [Epsilonproteobacteria bacterium]|nr:MAG: hypothetical protein DRG78_07960 [Campylobacterota bacterium]
MKINNLVNVPGKHGIGKIVNILENNTIDIEFFISISHSTTEIFAMELVTEVFLGKQTRIYNNSTEFGWRIGRVIDYENMEDNPIEYEIQFSNGVKEWLTDGDVYVRCLLTLEDPTDVLAYSYGETQFLHDARYKVINWLIDLRATSRGMTAVTSASIELVVHQVNIARKILSDPIQRYLLSDEVGMGKTIEAGIIARQTLLDSFDSEVLIIVPKHLISKWSMEMYDRFYLNDFEDRVNIISPENFVVTDKIPELIIIDEAHHIIGNVNTYERNIQLEIVNSAIKANKLLMLTATPGIGDEEILFNLIKVLDPLIFKDEDIDSFKLKLEKQREHGVFLRSLKTSQSKFLLKRTLLKVDSLFPDDNYALTVANQILDNIENNNEIDKLIPELKSHIIETWNLHNRLIRTRRIDSEGWEFQERGDITDGKFSQEHIKLFIHPNQNYEQINIQLENWRSEVSLNIENYPKNIIESLIKRYILLLESVTNHPDTLHNLLDDLQKDILFESEGMLLNNIKESIDNYSFDSSIKTTSKYIIDFVNNIEKDATCVIFVSNIELANIYTKQLKDITTRDSVYNIDELISLDKHILKFFEENKNARFLICNKNGEEGLDLQFADAIIHLDLPLNPSRIEQRIGRLDRFGRKKSNKIQHLVILPTDDISYPWSNWFELLIDGFGIFSEPISDIQLKLENITKSIHTNLLKYGSTSLEDYFNIDGKIESTQVEYIRNIIVQEREYLDEQYALNYLTLSESDSLNLRDEIEDGEYEEKEIENDINHWLFKVLRFYKWHANDKSFELQWDKKTIVPTQQFWTQYNKIITNMWEGEFKTSLDRNLTYFRKESIENSNVSLLRPGHPLFYALQQYMNWEDRGTTFSTFRVVDDSFPIFIPRNDIKITFKLVFVVETGYPVKKFENKNNINKQSYLRRCDDYMAPKVFTIFIDEELSILDDQDIIDVLEEPYIKDRLIDTNLSTKSNIIEHFIDKNKFKDLCNNVSNSAKDILFESDNFRNFQNNAINKVTTDVEQRCTKLTRRFNIQNKNNISTDNHFTDMINFEKSLIEGIKHPTIRLDSIGTFFLSRFQIDELDLDIE